MSWTYRTDPSGWQTRWSSLPRLTEPVRHRHHLTLKAPLGNRPSVGRLRVYQPDLKEN